MWQIFVGSLVLSVIHALIPNHWIPLIAIGKTEKWSKNETLSATLITGFSHTLSTVIIGIIVGFLGYALADQYAMISQTIAPLILVGLGLVYIIIDLGHLKNHKHHTHDLKQTTSGKEKSRWAVLTSLSIAMFLTPCVELEAYYFQAGTIGWSGIFIVSVVYTLTTVTIMLILVYLGMKGINRFNSHFLEHHEKLMTGLILVILGLLALFVEY
jgi:nickel/cobalt transporter (NicO) family protein